jgi:hypothetical protein
LAINKLWSLAGALMTEKGTGGKKKGTADGLVLLR